MTASSEGDFKRQDAALEKNIRLKGLRAGYAGAGTSLTPRRAVEPLAAA
jgi:hypothetical protein